VFYFGVKFYSLWWSTTPTLTLDIDRDGVESR
jgi:hypothetical protein